jgi:hypothetical protein
MVARVRGPRTIAVVVLVLASVWLGQAPFIHPAGTALAASATFTPAADTWVNSSFPGANYGADTRLEVDQSPVKEIYLRFDVSGVGGTITSAKLRVYCVDRSAGSGGTVARMTDVAWDESTVTYASRPAMSGPVIGTLGPVSQGTWYEIDVTSVVTGNGTFGFGLTSSATDGADYAAREDPSFAPQLVITTGTQPPAATITLPGTFQVEDYRLGGEGVGYHDTTAGNNGGQYRGDNVDIQTCTDPTSSPCYNVGWVAPGEWLAYEARFASTGSYTFTVRVATPYSGKRFHLELDGANISGAIAVPNTGGYQRWTSISTGPIQVDAGDSTLRIVAETSSFNLNYVVVTATTGGGDAVLVGAGDIADCGVQGDEKTAGLLDDIPGTVYTLGDNAYPNGSAASFTNCYNPSWGRHKSRTRPAVGNHEYQTANAAGYFGYFGSAAGDPAKGYYSYDLGAWHIVVINSMCWRVGGCGPSSPQVQWLRQDLAANPEVCALAYWHHPYYNSGEDGGYSFMSAFWQALVDYGVDVALQAHNHAYERFAPLDADGNRNDARGVRSFVVGTGGKSLYPWGAIHPHSQVRNNTALGVLKLTLHATSYDWQFVPEAGKSFTDTGSGTCH